MRKIDGKYHIEGEMILNTKTRDPIPLSEPLFLLRARDHHAFGTVGDYEERCLADCGPQHLAGIAEQKQEFDDFRREHPDKMKEPGNSIRGRKDPPAELVTLQELVRTDWKVTETILRRLEKIDAAIKEIQNVQRLRSALKPEKRKPRARGRIEKRNRVQKEKSGDTRSRRPGLRGRRA